MSCLFGQSSLVLEYESGSENSKIMFYTYILESVKNKDLYIGYTSDLKKRLEEHNSGKSTSTKRYMPWRLIYYEACLLQEDALRRENYFKTSQGRRMFRKRLKEYFFKK